jgi:Xaa-Pro aminopeptidase
MLLLDSGGQYDCGTTDITRTMHYGTPTPHQCACYTRVLQVSKEWGDGCLICCA